MNRRDFLRIPFAGKVASTAAPCQPAAQLDLPLVPSAGYPGDYVRHVPVLVEDARAWLVRDDTGFYAVDAVCPHQDGMIRFVDKAFVCPCHGTVFAPDGSAVSGATHHALRYLRVDMDETGQLIIQRDHTVTPDDRLIA